MGRKRWRAKRRQVERERDIEWEKESRKVLMSKGEVGVFACVRERERNKNRKGKKETGESEVMIKTRIESSVLDGKSRENEIYIRIERERETDRQIK